MKNILFLKGFLLLASCSPIANDIQLHEVEREACAVNNGTAYLSELDGLYSCHEFYFLVDHDINLHDEYGNNIGKLKRITDSVSIADGYSVDTNNLTGRIRELTGAHRVLWRGNDIMHCQVNINYEIVSHFPEYANTGKQYLEFIIMDKTNKRQIISAFHLDNILELKTTFPEGYLPE